jgi:RimJ/RimL family protein N-acetyltransferase
MTSSNGGSPAQSAAATTIEAGNYPKRVALKQGRTVELRLMTRADAGLLLAFFRGIPQEDLLFLRRDVTDPKVTEQWAERVERGAIETVLAFEGGKVVGEASLHLSSTPWSEHVGEVRVVVDRSMRQTGLGTRLTSEIFLLALQRGIAKIVAEMTIEQKAAIAVFQKLGFRVEGLLRNHVRDRAGATHDLVLMAHETQEFAEQMQASGFEADFTDGVEPR